MKLPGQAVGKEERVVRKALGWEEGQGQALIRSWREGRGSLCPPPHCPSCGLRGALTWGWGPCVQVAQLPLSLKDHAWHHICITWTTRDGLWSAYQDGTLRGSGENLAAWHPIKPHGILILGQEQVRHRCTGPTAQVNTAPAQAPEEEGWTEGP